MTTVRARSAHAPKPQAQQTTPPEIPLAKWKKLKGPALERQLSLMTLGERLDVDSMRGLVLNLKSVGVKSNEPGLLSFMDMRLPGVLANATKEDAKDLLSQMRASGYPEQRLQQWAPPRGWWAP